LGNFYHFKRRKSGKVETPLNINLEDIEWGEFKLGDLFEINTGSLVSNQKLKRGDIPRISAKSDNNGVIGYFGTKDLPEARHFKNFISVNFFGTDGGIFYHQYEASIEMKVHVLKLKNKELNLKIGNFLITMLKPILKGFSYGKQLSSSKLKQSNFKIKLPIKNEKIDFEFMENFISQLEMENIKELEEYLLTNNLKDYTLTEEEQEVLKDFENGKIEWSKFNLEKLFGESTRGKRLKSDDRVSGKLPFVTAGEANEGVSAFIGNNVTIFSRNTITIDMFGSAKYRNYKYGADDHITVVHTERIPKFASIFITSAIHKASYTGEFHYGKNFYSKDADKLNISLPTKNQKPNYKLMETLISAIQKLVIKDVVLHIDKKSKELEMG
jgi:hypothetical protein